jgi:hypothetical protein
MSVPSESGNWFACGALAPCILHAWFLWFRHNYLRIWTVFDSTLLSVSPLKSGRMCFLILLAPIPHDGP